MLEAKKKFTVLTTNASFWLFICAFVFASNSSHFRNNDFLLFFIPLFLLNYFLFNLFLFLQKSGGEGGGGGLKPSPAPPSARSLIPKTEVPERHCTRTRALRPNFGVNTRKKAVFITA